ncbi:hypothetical protein SteCoe_20262 [Stentor coeruleus]|uniref:Uncharacterized protein n=1 Tax=Stentor coeruleus TaxID=5963 RepID=A0A1R2BSF4_9CILI|nr:hypothetical protein SteCoe_20262 [Stentor coeruleus]
MSSNYFLEFKHKTETKHIDKIREILNRSPMRSYSGKASVTKFSHSSFLELPKVKDPRNVEEVLQSLGLRKKIQKIKAEMKKPIEEFPKDKTRSCNEVLETYINKNNVKATLNSLTPKEWIKLSKRREKSAIRETKSKIIKLDNRSKTKNQKLNSIYS